ncbi:MAG TPA: hypothetical protein VFK11_04100 [Candidatus Saccharimonadales bacterium]|nr:hypothetical protein [Candidatus Saccharimonadales bacterium]
MEKKQQKKPSGLSMGGVMPRNLKKLNPVSTVRIPQNGPPKQTQQKKPIPKPRPINKRKINPGSALEFIKSNILYAVVPVFILALYLFNINVLPPHMSSTDISADYQNLSDAGSFDFLPVKIILVIFAKLHLFSYLYVRLLSVALMLFALFCFYKLLAGWISRRVAVFSVLLFASSSWALSQTRQDNVTAMLFGVIPVILYLGNLALHSKSTALRILSSILLAQVIFVPGAVWFLLSALIIYALYEKDEVIAGKLILPFSVLMLTLAASLGIILRLSLDIPTQALKMLGLQVGSLPSVASVKNGLLELPGQLFYNGLNDSSSWLYGTPIIDWISAVLLIAGIIYLAKTRLFLTKKRFMFTFLVLCIVLIAVNGPVFISLLLPLAYMFVAFGITYLIDQWLIIFPNNPLPRMLGLGVVGLVVLMIIGYHAERYFIGWPKTDAYHQIFKV